MVVERGPCQSSIDPTASAEPYFMRYGDVYHQRQLRGETVSSRAVRRAGAHIGDNSGYGEHEIHPA